MLLQTRYTGHHNHVTATRFPKHSLPPEPTRTLFTGNALERVVTRNAGVLSPWPVVALQRGKSSFSSRHCAQRLASLKLSWRAWNDPHLAQFSQSTIVNGLAVIRCLSKSDKFMTFRGCSRVKVSSLWHWPLCGLCVEWGAFLTLSKDSGLQVGVRVDSVHGWLS